VKLGEALAQRAELQARVNELKGRLAASALVQEGDSPPEDPADLLAQVDRNCDDLERLIAAINRANSRAQLPSGLTLTEALARRDVLGIRHGLLRGVAEATDTQRARYSRSEIRMVRTLDVAALRRQSDELARDRRLLDIEIQEANWTVDLEQEG
jgi:hypothetical protein